MKIGAGIQTTVRFCFRHMRVCTVGITDGGIFELRRFDGLRCLDICIKFHEDWSSLQKLMGRGYTYRQKGDLISLLLFF
jgi:hypothetical protein